MALRVRADAFGFETGINVREIGRVSQLVSELTGYAVQRNKAIVGASAFAHEAGIHQDGMLKDASTYQIMDPEELGLTMTLPLGKHSGRHAFRQACEEAGVHLSDAELNAALPPLQGARRHPQGRHALRRLRGGGGMSYLANDRTYAVACLSGHGIGARGHGARRAARSRASRVCTASG